MNTAKIILCLVALVTLGLVALGFQAKKAFNESMSTVRVEIVDENLNSRTKCAILTSANGSSIDCWQELAVRTPVPQKKIQEPVNEI